MVFFAAVTSFGADYFVVAEASPAHRPLRHRLLHHCPSLLQYQELHLHALQIIRRRRYPYLFMMY